MWGKGERVGKDFAFADGEEQRCVYEMYARAGLEVVRHTGVAIPRDAHSEHPTPTAPHPAAPGSSAALAPLSERATAARAALARAERRLGMTPPNRPAPAHHDDRAQPTVESTADRATEPQLGLIARLITTLRMQGDTDAQAETAHAIDAIGASFGIANMSSLRSTADLRSAATRLTKPNATRLIDALKALDHPLTHSA